MEWYGPVIIRHVNVKSKFNGFQRSCITFWDIAHFLWYSVILFLYFIRHYIFIHFVKFQTTFWSTIFPFYYAIFIHLHHQTVSYPSNTTIFILTLTHIYISKNSPETISYSTQIRHTTQNHSDILTSIISITTNFQNSINFVSLFCYSHDFHQKMHSF